MNLSKTHLGFLDFKVKLQMDFIYFHIFFFFVISKIESVEKYQHPNILNLSLQLLCNIDKLTEDSGILPLILKKISNMPLFANYIGACPCFDARLS